MRIILPGKLDLRFTHLQLGRRRYNSQIMPYCQARLCDKWLYFPGEKPARFYRPYQCGYDAEKGGILCTLCNEKRGTGKTQISRGFDHGFVGDLIPPSSHAYGGPWYLSKVASLGEPSEKTLKEAIEYLEEEFDVTASPEIAALFRAGMTTTTKSAIMPPSKTTTAAPATARKKREENSTTTTQRKKQAVADLPAIPEHAKESREAVSDKILKQCSTIMPKIIETIAEPLDVSEVVYVEIEPFKFDGSKYYRDINTNDIYERLENKAMGKLLGVYNEKAHAIVAEDE
jgi:hypothetical protein